MVGGMGSMGRILKGVAAYLRHHSRAYTVADVESTHKTCSRLKQPVLGRSVLGFTKSSEASRKTRGNRRRLIRDM